MMGVSLNDLGAEQQAFYALQLALGVVFVLSCVPKLRDWSTFARTVQDYQVAGPRASRAAASIVVGIECLLAISFFTGAFLEPAIGVAVLLLFAFAAATALNLRRERDISCGCFGDRSERISGRTLVRIGLLIVAAVILGAALVTGQAAPTTLGDLTAEGASGAEYLVDIAGISAAMLLLGAWTLHGDALAYVLRGAVRGAAHRPYRSAGKPTRTD